MPLQTANKSTIPKTHALIKEQGADLSNYFVNFAVCCPSRVSYLTGRCSHNSGVVWNAGVGYTGGEYRFLEQQLENQTFAYALQVRPPSPSAYMQLLIPHCTSHKSQVVLLSPCCRSCCIAFYYE